LLQAFGITSFLIFGNLFFWGLLLIFKKKITNFSFKILFVTLYLIFGSLFFKLFGDSSFWLPDNGYGGFLGKYLISLIPLEFYQFKTEISYTSLAIGISFFFLSLGLTFMNWMNLIKTFFSIIVNFVSRIFKKRKNETPDIVEDLGLSEEVPSINKSFKPNISEAQASLNLNDSFDQQTDFTKFEYKLPLKSFLNDPEENKIQKELTETYEKQSKFLEETLLDFGIMGKIKRVSPGPVVTLYELEPAAGIKTSKIINLSDDIARSTSSISTRIATVPGKNTIGIEIPNKFIEPVNYKEIVNSKEFNNKEIRLPITLGKSISGYPIIGDLASMPHLLIAGTTGSGKSVCINTLILSILYKHKPEDCKLILIDPKMLELSVYQGIPHLLSPVITEPKKAKSALKWTVNEMENRYRQMTEEGVRNISSYNDKARKEGKKVMPYIVVVVDEMADLMLSSGKEIESYIQRLAQMARAAGVHIIMATQRPSVDVITGTIKANFPTRISFQVTSKIDSRTILGEQGAELLLGKGDMLFMSSASRTIRIHGPFVSDREIEKISTFLRSQGSPEYIDDITKMQTDENEDNNAGSEEKDELFSQAVSLIKSEGKASTSFLQRKLQIGYNRAARIIDQMEEAKIISPANHTGKREIYT
tara:strand:+ start:13846 stop:15786 length:1941 start_codon:yes stop_codon:yes gene_type:complete